MGTALAALSILPPSAAPADDERVAAVVRRAQAGDMAAFADLYRAHVGRIHALCVRLSGDAELARVLTQDAFVRAWEKLDGFRGDATFATWLHRLAVNLVLGDRRTRLRRLAREHESAALAESTGAPLGRVDAGVDLERAIAELPPGARTVFVLYEIEGYRHDEIAEMMDLSVGTSKAQLHRARALLRGVLT
ncbi:MAG TPA: sigma-70 family RNA polymerase sigma factor [Nannocystaceae bacterium]|nr:sigma-70 family RNA polymerase sigma factor [Nannocystaceae bacterium]